MTCPVHPTPSAHGPSQLGALGVARQRFEPPDRSIGSAGRPLTWNKPAWSGAIERLRLLAAWSIVIPHQLGSVGDSPVDDVLDAAAAAWSASRIVVGWARSLPDEPPIQDRRRVAIWY